MQNQLNTTASTDSDETPVSPSSASDSSDPFRDQVVALIDIEFPDDGLDVYEQYCCAVNAIARDPAKMTAPECIVCGEQHRFSDCAVLNNVDFLRQHYIRYKQLQNRDTNHLASGGRQRDTRVNMVSVDDFDHLMSPDTDREIDNFQNGRP